MKNLLSDEQRSHLRLQHKKERDKRVCDRIKAVLLSDEGWSTPQIAHVLLLSDEAIRQHILDYQQDIRMDRMQNKRELLHSDITEKIIGCCFEVMKELGSGFLENVYKNALFLAMEQKGLSVLAEQAFEVSFRSHKIGKYIADLIVENLIIVELKCCKVLLPEHQAQLINYLKASEKPVGLLVDFGNPKLEYKRLHHPDKFIELGEYDHEPLSFLKPHAEDKALDSSSCPS